MTTFTRTLVSTQDCTPSRAFYMRWLSHTHKNSNMAAAYEDTLTAAILFYLKSAGQAAAIDLLLSHKIFWITSSLCLHACVCSLSISLFSGPNIHYSRTSLCSKFKRTYCSNLWSQPSISGNDRLLRQWQTCGNCKPIVLLIIPAVRSECVRQALVSLPKLSLENLSSFPQITWSGERLRMRF